MMCLIGLAVVLNDEAMRTFSGHHGLHDVVLLDRCTDTKSSGSFRRGVYHAFIAARSLGGRTATGYAQPCLIESSAGDAIILAL